LEEFLADVERRRHQTVLDSLHDMSMVFRHLAKTYQDTDPVELIEARNMALATIGVYADCTPTMVWNFHFGNKEDFYAGRFAQVRARHPFLETQDATEPRKRAAAVKAPDA
jgi:hypothetical protein